jgi:drug/metabolite transporter (DMT)-like permease
MSEAGAQPTSQSADAKQRAGKAGMAVLWTSGYIVGALAVRHAPGLSLTFWRMVLAAPLMAGLAFAMRAEWPRDRKLIVQMAFVGVLLQAVQFAGIYLALEQGVPVGVPALLAGTSPLAVAVVAAVALGERLERRQWIGSAIGVGGVVLAVIDELGGGGSVAGFLFALLGLTGLVGATLLQRKVGGEIDLRAANAIQLAAAAAILAPVTALTQGFSLGAGAIAPLTWLILALSIGAVLLFFWLLRREKSGEATSFLYVVPGLTAIVAVPVLGQPLGVGAVIGLALALIGVRMVSSAPAPRPVRRAGRRIGRLVFG